MDRQHALLERVVATARQLNDIELLASAQCALALAHAATDASKARAAFATAQTALRSMPISATATQVTCLRARSSIEQADAQPERAIATLQEALSIVDAAPASTATAKIAVLTDLSEHYYVSDRSSEALDLIDRILDLQDASGRGGSMSKAVTLMNRAAILSRMGEIRTAAANQREAIRLAARFGDDNLRIEFESHLAASLVRLTRCEEVLPLLEKGVAAAAQSGNARRAASAQLLLGYCYIRIGRFDAVPAPLARAEEIWSKNQSANQRMLNETALARAELKLRTGHSREAVADVDAIMRSVGYPQTKRPPGISSILYRAALAHLADANYERARHLAAESADAASRAARNADHSADVGQARLIEADALAGLGNVAAARTTIAAAIAALEHGFGPEHPDTRQARAIEERLSAASVEWSRARPATVRALPRATRTRSFVHSVTTHP